jgi:hypothetical protein
MTNVPPEVITVLKMFLKVLEDSELTNSSDSPNYKAIKDFVEKVERERP